MILVSSMQYCTIFSFQLQLCDSFLGPEAQVLMPGRNRCLIDLTDQQCIM
jgi:hypothetical protein